MSDLMIIITVVISLLGLPLLLALWINFFVKYRKLKKRFAPIVDLEAEKAKFEKLVQEIRSSYTEKRRHFDNLVEQVALYDEEVEMLEYGFYKPHFDFDTSEMFKDGIRICKDKQKQMVKKKEAVICTTEWAVEGSKAKGRTMTNRNIRLTSRAFNNECDALIANVRWNNAERMEERIRKSATAIDKMNESNKTFISKVYVALKIEELRLTHEFREKKQQEKEEQSAIRAQMREETKLQKEVEDAVKEEDKYENLLEKARNDAAKAAGAELEKLQAKMALLEDELKEAQDKKERALSMAQQTKQGHVYIISNIGSFGEQVYKIGMTRRLDPMDRVNELGDASVPFKFDVHAMIHSEDAPSLENAIHKAFDTRRLNLVNLRREFFNVTLAEIEEEVRKKFPDAEFIETIEAREFRESETIRRQRAEKKEVEKQNVVSMIPEAI